MAQGSQAGLLANLAAAPVKLEGHGRALDRDSLGALSERLELQRQNPGTLPLRPEQSVALAAGDCR